MLRSSKSASNALGVTMGAIPLCKQNVSQTHVLLGYASDSRGKDSETIRVKRLSRHTRAERTSSEDSQPASCHSNESKEVLCIHLYLAGGRGCPYYSFVPHSQIFYAQCALGVSEGTQALRQVASYRMDKEHGPVQEEREGRVRGCRSQLMGSR